MNKPIEEMNGEETFRAFHDFMLGQRPLSMAAMGNIMTKTMNREEITEADQRVLARAMVVESLAEALLSAGAPPEKVAEAVKKAMETA